MNRILCLPFNKNLEVIKDYWSRYSLSKRLDKAFDLAYYLPSGLH